LATTTHGGQQADEPAQQRPDNLFEPLPGVRGAHGRFGTEAQDTVGAYDPALLRICATFAGIGLLGGTWLLARATVRQDRRPRKAARSL
ncbi:hypothetical protein ACFHPP_29385, partial [Falsiroseomonas sp. E2-1-a20]